MATRSNIHFTNEHGIQSNIYVHYDGYPENRLAELSQFFQDVKEATRDTRFTDPTYLAAKFVVWYVSRMALGYRADKHPLDFLGIGVAQGDNLDSDYIYTVDCSLLVDGFPTVSFKQNQYV